MSWHRTDKLMSFSMAVYNKTWNQNREGSGSFEAPHGMRTLGCWAKAVRLPRELTARRFWPVCYGGGFTASRDAARRLPRQVWRNLERSLRRADNIEEGHYMERTWAALFTQPLSYAEESALACAIQGVRPFPSGDYAGAIRSKRCRCSQVELCSAMVANGSLQNRSSPPPLLPFPPDALCPKSGLWPAQS